MPIDEGRGGDFSSIELIIQQRKEICEMCPFLIGKNICSGHDCGCYRPIQLTKQEDKCPRGNW